MPPRIEPVKPPDILLELWEKLSKNKKGPQINGIVVKSIVFRVDQSKTIVKLLNHDTVVYDGPWTTIAPYIKVEVGHNSIVTIKDDCLAQVVNWNNFVRRNKEDYTTYLRLKERFEAKGE